MFDLNNFKNGTKLKVYVVCEYPVKSTSLQDISNYISEIEISNVIKPISKKDYYTATYRKNGMETASNWSTSVVNNWYEDFEEAKKFHKENVISKLEYIKNSIKNLNYDRDKLQLYLESI